MSNTIGEKRYSVGELSKIVHISTSALRFYDKKGVFSPQIRDSNSLYRYYTEEQVLQALLLAEMRQMDFSLNELKQILHGVDILTLKEKLEDRISSLRAEIKLKEDQCNHVTEIWKRVNSSIDILLKVELSPCDVWSIRFFQGFQAVSLPCHGNFYMQAEMEEIYIKLYEVCQELGLRAKGAVRVKYQNERDTRFSMASYESEWILRIEETNLKDPRIITESGFWGICFSHIGELYDLPKTYAKALATIDEMGLKITGPSQEEHVLVYGLVRDHRFNVINIIFPIEMNI